MAFDVWFDQWTPGDAGSLIHTWWFDSANDITRYRTLNITGDTLGTQRTVFTESSAVAGRGAFISGTKTRSGYLYCAYDIDAGAERGFRRSTDAGATWSPTNLSTSFVEATLDTCKLFPASGTGDDNDCWALYYDASATALTLKLWDSSAASATESATIVTMTDGPTDLTGQYGWDAGVRHSDGHLIVAAVTLRDNASSQHQVFDITSTSTITAKTNITTNIDDHYYPQVFINQGTGTLFVAYNGKRDGTETLDTTSKVYYTYSLNGGTTWNAGDAAYMEGAAGVVQQVWTPITGQRFYCIWRVGTTLVGNKVNSLIQLVAQAPTIVSGSVLNAPTVSYPQTIVAGTVAASITVTIGAKTGATFTGFQDTHLRLQAPTQNYFDSLQLDVTKYDVGDWTHSVVKASGLSNIPTSGRVIDASVNMAVNTASAGTAHTLTVRRLLRDWVDTQATWNNFSTGNAWTTAGGTSTSDRSATVSATVSVATGDVGSYKAFTAAQLIADVQAMVSGALPNYGWHIERTDAQEDSKYRTFHSSESASATLRPYLSVTYTTSGPFAPTVARAPSAILSNPQFALQGTASTADLNDDGYTFAAQKPIVIDQWGKILIWAERVNGGTSVHRPVISNDAGVTWIDPPISGFFNSAGEGYFNRCMCAYDGTNDLFHCLWQATGTGDGIIYRRYSVTRDGEYNITGVTRVSGINLQLDYGIYDGMEHPSIIWVPPDVCDKTHGQILCVWGVYYFNGTPNKVELRASMCVLSNTTADNTPSNWVAPVSDDATSISLDAAVPYSILYSHSGFGVPPYAGIVRKTYGSHINDVYIGFHDGNTSAFGGAWKIRRMVWDAANSDWSNTLGAVVTLDNSILAGADSGYTLKNQLGSQLSEDTIYDRVYFGYALWKNDTDGDTSCFRYIDSSDVVSARVDVDSAGGAHAYAPCIDLVCDPYDGNIAVAYEKTDRYFYVKAYNGITVVQAETVMFNAAPGDIPLLYSGGRYQARLLSVFRDSVGTPTPPYDGYAGTMYWGYEAPTTDRAVSGATIASTAALGAPAVSRIVQFGSLSTTLYTSQVDTTITAPTGIVAGDLLLLVHLLGASSTQDNMGPWEATLPSGFALMEGPSNVIDSQAFKSTRRLAKKVATGSEPSTYTVSHALGVSQCVIIRVTGGATTNTHSSKTNGYEVTALARSVTTEFPNALILFITQSWEFTNGSLVVPVGSTPTFTERLDANNSCLYVATGELPTAGATGDKSHASSTANSLNPWATFLIAVESQVQIGTTITGGTTVGTYASVYAPLVANLQNIVAGTVVGSGAPPPAFLTSQLAYWPFDEGSGLTAADAIGARDVDLYDHGQWLTPGKFGGSSLHTSGVATQNNFPTTTLGSSDGTYTVSLWIKDWNGSDDGIILGASSGDYAFYIDSTNIYHSSGPGNFVTVAHGGLTGGWHHLVVTVLNASGTMQVRFYKNGTLLSGSPQTFSLASLLVNTFGAYEGGTFPIDITIDDARIWDHLALSDAQVAELYTYDPSVLYGGTAAVYSPSVAHGVAGGQSVTAATLASASTLTVPSVAPGAVTVTAATITTVSVARVPTIIPGAVTVTTITRATTAQVNVPVIAPGAVTVITPIKATTVQVFVVTVSVGAVAVSSATIATASLVRVPSIVPGVVTISGATQVATSVANVPIVSQGAVTVAVPVRASTIQVFAPTLTALTTGATIVSGSGLFAPSVAIYITTAPIAATAVVRVLTVAPPIAQVTTATRVSTLQVNVPSVVVGAATVVGAIRLTTAQVFAPIVIGAGAVATIVITTTAQLFVPVITPPVSLVTGAPIVSGSQISAPTIFPAAVQVMTDSIVSTVQLIAPSLTTVVGLVAGTVSPTVQLFEPFVAVYVTGLTITSTAQLFAPDVAPEVGIIVVGGLVPTADVFPPSITRSSLVGGATSEGVTIRYLVTSTAVTCMMLATSSGIAVRYAVTAEIQS